MKFSDSYILPTIFECKDIEEAKGLGGYTFWKDSIGIDSLLSEKYSIILAKAGYGKSRLLKEIYMYSTNSSLETAYIDIKKVARLDIHDFYNFVSNLKKKSSIPKSVDDSFSKATQNLSLDENSTDLICFDCLDELSKSEVLSFYDLLNKLLSECKNLKVILASRIEHFEKYEIFLKNKVYKIFKISEFSKEKVVEYLDCYKVNGNIINRITTLDVDLIYIPRYLNYLVIVSKYSPEKLLCIKNRKGLLESVIIAKFEE